MPKSMISTLAVVDSPQPLKAGGLQASRIGGPARCQARALLCCPSRSDQGFYDSCEHPCLYLAKLGLQVVGLAGSIHSRSLHCFALLLWSIQYGCADLRWDYQADSVFPRQPPSLCHHLDSHHLAQLSLLVILVAIQICDSTHPLWPWGCSFDCGGLIYSQRLDGCWLFSFDPSPRMEMKQTRQHLDWAAGWCGHVGTLSCCYLVPISQLWWCFPELLEVFFGKHISMPNSPKHLLLNHFLLPELPIWPHFDLGSSSRPSSGIPLPQQSCSFASW